MAVLTWPLAGCVAATYQEGEEERQGSREVGTLQTHQQIGSASVFALHPPAREQQND